MGHEDLLRRRLDGIRKVVYNGQPLLLKMTSLVAYVYKVQTYMKSLERQFRE